MQCGTWLRHVLHWPVFSIGEVASTLVDLQGALTWTLAFILFHSEKHNRYTPVIIVYCDGTSWALFNLLFGEVITLYIHITYCVWMCHYIMNVIYNDSAAALHYHIWIKSLRGVPHQFVGEGETCGSWDRAGPQCCRRRTPESHTSRWRYQQRRWCRGFGSDGT